jgi:maleylpyruvate isomerase
MSLANIPGIISATASILAACDGLTDEQCRAPSHLPGWSRGHVLTHLARNGDAIGRLCQGLIDGVPGAMYPAGPEQRAADIESGAVRPAEELVEDFAKTAAKLQLLIPQVTAETWATATVQGVTRQWPATNVPWMRRRELETHLVDLDLGVTFTHLPDDYLRAELALAQPRLAEAGLSDYATKADLATVVAWVLGRSTPEGWPTLSWG